MVDVIESTLVVPSEETPREKRFLSNLEQVGPSWYTCTVYYYKNNGAREFFSIEVVKAALAKALVLFYPLAGRFVVGSDGRKMIDCNAEGALLVVARTNLSSDAIDFTPSSDLRNQFVPKATSQSLMIMLQVTHLKCGGVVLGSATNHALVDGRGAFHFFQTWAQFARGEHNIIVAPSFDNTMLRARYPPTITFDHPEYGISQDEVKNKMNHDSRVLTQLKLSSEQISSLKSRCNEGSNATRVSTFCALSALFWKCYCIAQELPPGTETRLNFSADVRKRLQPPLPEKFFGSAVIRTSAIAEVTKVSSNPIYIAANTVKTAIDRITDDYIRSFIDYVEVNQDKNLKPIRGLPKSNLRISNITGMPVYEADFGWGAPQIMTWAEITGINVIYIINEQGKDAGVIANVLLDSDTMHKFEKAFYEESGLQSHQS